MILLWALAGAIPLRGTAETLNIQGQLSGWLTANHLKAAQGQFGLRYIPSFSLTKSLSKKVSLDAEISLNAYSSADAPSLSDIQTQGEIKPYRLWLRFATAQFEARLGLQKINFGSALLLRPLMWFDRIDPNDPLQLADGVYGLLLKYTFLNNVNIWLWTLYGNDDLKGWEVIPTQEKCPELGGRFQFPLWTGEMAFSYHHRRIDPGQSLIVHSWENEKNVPENRFGLDGKWDIGVGLWFEGVLTHQDFVSSPLKYQKNINIGMDYTFAVGNGLHVLAEHLVMDTSENALNAGETVKFSALSLDYSLGLLDRIKGMVFHNWKTGDWYRFITWQRTYDRWGFFIIVFWNPEHYQIYASQSGKNFFSGRGIQVMAVFNH